jgi:hypothetical protein
METEFVTTRNAVTMRDFGYSKPHKYGIEFASGRATAGDRDNQYVRIIEVDAFIRDFNIAAIDVLDFATFDGETLVKLFRPDDFWGLIEKFNMPDVRVYATGFTPDQSVLDLYYVPEWEREHTVWLRSMGLAELRPPSGTHAMGHAIKVAGNRIVDYKRYSFSKKGDPFGDLGTFLLSRERVTPGGEIYRPLSFNRLLSL